MDALSYFALFIIIFVVLTLAYGMIAIHDIPYHIAKKRNHPHQDAIHTGGWISLFTPYNIVPGSIGSVAIYTHHFHHLSILRKVLLRMKSWMNYLFSEGH